MKPHKVDKIRLIIPEAALIEIFDECDRFDHDETGGRVIGTFEEEAGKLTLHIKGIIESGPRAQRSPVFFMQDGDFQEPIFRQIEQRHPEIEHLGNWHTHHMNGLQTLSSGDLATYHRTVNHRNHNTSFFYALLVTTKHKTTHPHERYSIKHYIFRRGDDRTYEVPSSHVEIVHTPLVWPTLPNDSAISERPNDTALKATPGRVCDRDVLSDLYPGFRSFASQKLGIYWRGPLELLDGSQTEVVVLEDVGGEMPKYSVTLRKPPKALTEVANELASQEFSSARGALITTERSCNRALYQQCSDNR